MATNMAGRGTDIVLGGNAKDLAKLQLEAALLDAVTVTVTGAMTLAVSAATRELAREQRMSRRWKFGEWMRLV